MTRPNPLYVLIYLIADFGAIAWLAYAATGDLPHTLIGVTQGAGTLLYSVIGIIGLLSLVATGQYLTK